MDGYQFLASLIGSLAWPISALGIAIFLRKPILQLLERITSAEAFGTKLNFERRLELVKDDVRAAKIALPAPADVEPEPDDQQPALPPPDKAISEVTDALSTSSATGSIIASWVELEHGLKSIAELNDLSWDDRNFRRNVNTLEQSGYLPRQLASALHKLRSIRNDVVHTKGAAPTLAEAAAFRETAQEIVDTVGVNAGLHRSR